MVESSRDELGLADVGDESLTLALLALLRANDCAIEYDEVN